MSSLKNAPSLTPTSRKGFSFATADDDDDYIGPVDTVEEVRNPSRSTSRSKKTKARDSKKSKKRKEVTPVSEEDEPISSSSSVKKTTGDKTVTTSYNHGEDYADDFEDPVDSDDYIPPVGTPPHTAPLNPAAKPKALMADVEAEEKRLYATVEEQLRLEKEEVMQRIAKWEVDQARKAEELRQHEEELKRQLAAQVQREQEMQQRVKDLVEEQVSQQVAAASTAGMTAAAPINTAVRSAVAKAGEHGEMEDVDEALTGASRAELQRRRRREHERALGLRRAEEEEAAHALFQRLAQDVREVFHELNLSVVAAEKERLIKDERYRRERELRDRREDMARVEKLEKELRERAEREAKFWAVVDQRDEKFRTFMEERMRKDEEEREARLRRDLEDRAARLRNERELREEMDKMDKERRAKAEEESRQHDSLVLTAQMEEVSARYRAQLEEVKRQMEADSMRKDEMQKTELGMMAKRHEAALEQLQRQHAQQLATMDGHVGNVSRVEALVAAMQETMEATKAMNEKLLAERVSVLQLKERQLDEQQAVLDAMVADMKATQETVAAERVRVAGLYAKFELALSSFSKSSEEDRRTFREAHAHYDTLRQQAEKDRRLMLGEVAQERKMLEQQFEEFLAKKMEAMAELQGERMAIARERAEASMVRERQNRDETDLLKSLRSREEEYRMKLESLESDRATACHLKDEHKRLCDAAAAELQALRQEREKFELEKKELLSRFDAIRRQAEDAASSQERLRIQFMGDRNDVFDGNGAATGVLRGEPLVCNAASRLQMDLARQRAVLQNIS
ncbi:hypothetical protein CUR178_03191 [Leishmania enriettii]|uniref:Fas-binding factor 1 C-terminal domain-containing protein n=1 Tax=Leishmania enriettii TaxID=5663 RepID=A0A836KGI9_LEIEN|nr:hypothetical protein CUR178_03191 [Leishmania enriettii]